MTTPSAPTVTSILAAIGAAGAVGGFIVLVGGERRKTLAIVVALAVLFVALGAIGWIEGGLNVGG